MNLEGPSQSRLLGLFLKQRRLGVDPASQRLGPYLRVPERVGRRVTQEEFAEAIGVSREWYSRLENGMKPRASAHLIQKIALALELDERDRLKMIGYGTSDLVAANARLQLAARDGILESVSLLRRFVQRVALANSFAEAAQVAVETTQQILQSDCVTMMALKDEAGARSGFAAGPRSRYWSELNNQVTFDAHEPLRDGGVGIVENARPSEDFSGDVMATMSWIRRNGDEREYEFRCDIEMYRECNDRLKGRSSVSLPLFEAGLYRGVLGSAWTSPRKVGDLEIEVAKTVASILELTAAQALRSRADES